VTDTLALRNESELVFYPEQAETLRLMEEEASNYNRWLLARGASHLGNRVLDVGAGIGTFTAEVADGRTVVALEPDPAFVPRLRRRFAGRANVEVATQSIEELRPEWLEELFDSIICFNVLEHIADDAAALDRLGSLLKPGGSLLALVPAHPAAFGAIDVTLGHERRYDKPLLRRRVSEAGLEIVKLRHVNPVGAVGWFVTSRLLRREQLPSGPLRLFDRLVPLLRKLDGLPVPFGLSLWAVARRPA
jgi:SAM-dependent methyltransferase